MGKTETNQTSTWSVVSHVNRVFKSPFQTTMASPPGTLTRWGSLAGFLRVPGFRAWAYHPGLLFTHETLGG